MMIRDPMSILTGVLGGLPCCCVPLVGLIALAVAAFWIWMVIDCATKMPDQGNSKIAWILVVILMNWLGALIYYLVVKLPRDQARRDG